MGGVNMLAILGLWNLLIPETHAGTCLAGWQKFRNSCYSFELQEKTYDEARADCESKAFLSMLTSVQDEEENLFLASIVKKAVPDPYPYHWIGLRRIHSGELVVWEDGHPLAFTKWSGQQPESVSQPCVYLHTGYGGWGDASCNYTWQYICKAPAIRAGGPMPTGPAGPIGPPGFPGRVGATGVAGYAGHTGATGFPGTDGLYGPPGPPGVVSGSHGRTGSVGPPGLNGPPGRMGYPGRTGANGYGAGSGGLSGQAGATGATGHDGYPGLDGRTGGTGVSGAAGHQGPVGPEGLPGVPGPAFGPADPPSPPDPTFESAGQPGASVPIHTGKNDVDNTAVYGQSLLGTGYNKLILVSLAMNILLLLFLVVVMVCICCLCKITRDNKRSVSLNEENEEVKHSMIAVNGLEHGYAAYLGWRKSKGKNNNRSMGNAKKAYTGQSQCNHLDQEFMKETTLNTPALRLPAKQSNTDSTSQAVYANINISNI